MLRNRNNRRYFFQIILFAFLFIFSGALYVFAVPPATPYLSSDAILDPNCAPGDTNCVVSAGALAIGNAVASGTSGSLLFVDASLNLTQNNSGLNWDNVLKKLTISQGLASPGDVSVIKTVGGISSPVDFSISGNYAYLVDQGSQDVLVIDITTPASASIVATVAIGVNASKISISGNYAYVINSGSGVGNDTVSVIDITTPASANVVATVTVQEVPSSISISGNYAYVVNTGSDSISVIDITTPASANVIATVTVQDGPSAISISGNYAYVTNQNSDSVSVIDITTPASANVIATVVAGDAPNFISISGNYAYVINAGGQSVSVIDITTPASANVIATVAVGNSPQKLSISGNYAYVVNQSQIAVSIVDITIPASANVVKTVAVGNNSFFSAQDISISGNYAYLTGIDNAGLSEDSSFIIDITTPTSATIIKNIFMTTYGSGSYVSTSGNYAYFYSGAGLFSILDISEVSSIQRPNDVVALAVDGTIQSGILAGTGITALYSDVNGNIVPSYSDASLKQNVTNITGALDKVKALQGVYFNWKDTEKYGDRKEMGFIAQQVEPIVPEVVGSVGNFKTLNYQNLIALQNEAIKELSLRVEAVGTFSIEPPIVKEKLIDLTSTQIQTANSAPVNTNISVNVGEAIEIISASMRFTANTNPFTSSVLSLITEGANTEQYKCTYGSNLVNSFVKCLQVESADNQFVDGAGLLIKADSDSLVGDGTVRIYITYKIITL
jgi:YVTN family beta-propeller protein